MKLGYLDEELLLWIRPTQCMQLGDSDGEYCFGLGPWNWEIQMGTIALYY